MYSSNAERKNKRTSVGEAKTLHSRYTSVLSQLKQYSSEDKGTDSNENAVEER